MGEKTQRKEVLTWSAAKLASVLGVSSRRVQQLADDGVVIRVSHGKYDLAASVQGYVEFVKASAAGPQDEDAKGLEREKIRLTKARADEAELRLTILRGDAVMMPDVEDLIADEYGALRQGLTQYPAKVASRASLMNDAPAIQALLTDALEETLGALTADRDDGRKPRTRELPGALDVDDDSD